MSVQAMVWALEDAVCADGKDVPAHLVAPLIGLANHADENGRGSRCATETIAWYCRKGRDAAKADLDKLEALGLIRRGDQRMVLHLPPDKRPVVYDLALERKRAARPERKRPGRPVKVKPLVSAGPENGGVSGPPGLNEDQTGNRGGLQTESGGSVDGIGGVCRPPEPPMNHPLNPPPPVVVEPDDQDPDAVAALLDQARLDAGLAVPVGRRSAAHRQVREALGRGWTSEQILAVLSQPLTGAAKPAAAFAWRVREQLADDPPRPPAQPGGKGGRWTVPWCGACDGDRTRRAYANRADATDATLAGPCPTCGQDSMRLVSVA